MHINEIRDASTRDDALMMAGTMKLFDAPRLSKMINSQLIKIRDFYVAIDSGILPYVNRQLSTIRCQQLFTTGDYPLVSAFAAKRYRSNVVPTSVERTISVANGVFDFGRTTGIELLNIGYSHEQSEQQNESESGLIRFGYFHCMDIISSIDDMIDNSAYANIGTEVAFIAAAYPSLFSNGDAMPMPNLVVDNLLGEDKNYLIYERVGEKIVLKKVRGNEYRNFIIPEIEWIDLHGLMVLYEEIRRTKAMQKKEAETITCG